MALDTIKNDHSSNDQPGTDRPQTAPASNIDPANVEMFAGKVFGDAGGMAATILASIGHRLGLFRALAQGGPATSSQLAVRAGLNERYTREWLAGMTTAGYLTHDPLTQLFTLPADHAPVLAQEGGPAFMGGIQQMLLGMVGPIDRVVEAFRYGGGVPQSAYPEDWWAGLDLFTAGWFENLLIQQWIPAMPAVQAALERGASVADVGCGRGRALVKLAQAYPNSRFVGYDVYGPAIEDSRARAAAAGVADRVRFEVLDVSKSLPETFDVITTFDVVHDAVDPSGLLRAIRSGLRPGGRYVCVDINCSEHLADEAGPLGTIRFGCSLMYCMTTSLAHQGAGIGTVGLTESKLRALCNEAGFGQFRRVPLDNPFNNLYEVAPANER